MTRIGRVARYALKWWIAAGLVYIGACQALEIPVAGGWRDGLAVILFFTAVLLVIIGALATIEIWDRLND